VTTRLGFSIIVAGIVLLVLRVIGTVDTELADILSVLAIVIGALGVAIDGDRPVVQPEHEPRSTTPPTSTSSDDVTSDGSVAATASSDT
jgi:hypothetical protein